MTPAALRRLLKKAGAIVREFDVITWTTAERTIAQRWALEQINADQHARPGTRVSVLWPDHVSRAHRSRH